MPDPSYDDTLPTDRDKARSVLGITDVTSAEAALLSDAHIDAALVWQGSLDGAVAFLASELAARYAQKPTTITTQGDSLTWAERVRYWLWLAARGSATGGNLAVISQVPIDYGVPAVDEFGRAPWWIP